MPKPTDRNVAPVINGDHLKRGIEAMKRVVFPDKAARNQKKTMKKLCKPVTMTFRTFANHLQKMNSYLGMFPDLPDGKSSTAFSLEEFQEVLDEALPKTGYQEKMQQHDYDPTTDDFHKFVDWVEGHCETFDNV